MNKIKSNYSHTGGESLMTSVVSGIRSSLGRLAFCASFFVGLVAGPIAVRADITIDDFKNSFVPEDTSFNSLSQAFTYATKVDGFQEADGFGQWSFSDTLSSYVKIAPGGTVVDPNGSINALFSSGHLKATMKLGGTTTNDYMDFEMPFLGVNDTFNLSKMTAINIRVKSTAAFRLEVKTNDINIAESIFFIL